MIRNFLDLSSDEQSNALGDIKEIFYLASSRQSFASAEDKDLFWQRWTGYYLQNCPGNLWVDFEDNTLAGYLMGCEQSNSALSFFADHIHSYKLFRDLFDQFPAHLHINLHPKFRNLGLGQKLVEAFLQQLSSTGSRGVHIVTSAGERNTHFYERLGFIYKIERPWARTNLLFMGRPLVCNPEALR